MSNNAKYHIILLDGDLDIRGHIPVYRNDALGIELAELLEPFDMHIRGDDNKTVLLESTVARNFMRSRELALSFGVWSNDDDDFKMGQVMLTKVNDYTGER